MVKWPYRSMMGAAAITPMLLTGSIAHPLSFSFDFSRSAILLDAAIRGTPLHVFLDTGVSPSVIDMARAKALGLKIDAVGGEASGDGNAKHAIVYPTSIDDLSIGGHDFGRIDALTLDMKDINRVYGRPVDGILGYSFLVGKITLIDYPAHRITIFDNEAEAAQRLAQCRKVWRTPLRSFRDDHIPVVELGIGSARLPLSIDTGSNGGIELYQRALDKRPVKSALVESGAATSTGGRGAYTVKVLQLNAPIRLGPFTLPAGQTVTLSDKDGSAKTRLANAGNKLFASMQLKLVLDYREHQLGFFGDCRD